MRIDLNFGNIDSLQTGSSRRLTEGSKDITRSDRRDEAVLSSGGSNVARLTAAALATPDIRTEKVAELRQSISTGNYSVDPGMIADAILNDIF